MHRLQGQAEDKKQFNPSQSGQNNSLVCAGGGLYINPINGTKTKDSGVLNIYYSANI